MTGLPRFAARAHVARLARRAQVRASTLASSLASSLALAPSARDRRAVRLGMAVLLPALAWSLVARPYLAALEETRARVAAERERLSRELALVAESRRHAGALTSLRVPMGDALALLLDGAGDPAATAALASYVGEAVEADHVLVRQVDPSVPDTTAVPGLTRTVLDVTGETDLTGLLTLLRGLELGHWLAPVEQLHVESRLAAHADGATQGSLVFRLRVAGFRPRQDWSGADVRIARTEEPAP